MKNQIEGMNRDCQIFWCELNKRTYWTLGYMNGGAINVALAVDIAEEFARQNKVDIESVEIAEIKQSRRYKYFKLMWSKEQGQAQPENALSVPDAWEFLHD